MIEPLVDTPFVPFAEADFERSVPEVFERLARQQPDRLAVVGEETRFTYGELDARANRIAAAVVAAVPDREPARVALWLDHDAPLIATALGVLKAGHTCVVIDPDGPEARAAQLVDASEAAAIVVSRAYAEAARRCAGTSRAVIDIETIPETRGPVARRAIDPGTPAILFYTSGSTGVPKGVARPHRMLLHSASAPINNFRICPADRLSALARIGTGQGGTPVWSALLSGASLHMFDLKRHGLVALAGWLNHERVTLLHSSTTTFRYLGRTLREGDRFPSVRLVRIGGEPVAASDAECFRNHFNAGAEFWNVFSMTETGPLTTFDMSGVASALPDPVPAGYAVPGKEITILDGDGQPAGPGEIGEIAVRSRYIAPGYWRAPELTGQRFSADADGSVTYRTGDFGRLRENGCLEFGGRRDRRVKIRGYRVELGEVEGCLARHPGVGDAAVVPRRDGHEITGLIAYITSKVEHGPRPLDLRRHLLETLPDQMVPSSFVTLDAMPLTPTGKIDRHTLETRADRIQPPAGSEPPRTETELRLAGLWTAVLGLDRIGIDEPFFESGGDSLRASQVLARIKDDFGRTISLRDFLSHSTIREVAGLVDRAPATGRTPAQTAIPRHDRFAALPLSHAQRQLWLADRLSPGTGAYNVARAARLHGVLNEPALRRAIDALVARHATLRTTVDLIDGEPMQEIHDPRPVEIVRVDLGDRPAADRDAALARLVDDEAARPFDLSRDLLLRAHLLRLSTDDHALVLVNHHIATDAWSAEVLLRELAALYEAFAAGQPSPLPHPPVEYADFAEWQRSQLSRQAAEREIGYWTDRLSGLPDAIEWPLDRSRAPVDGTRAGRLTITWPGALADRLETFASTERATLFMALLAGFTAFLHRYTGADDIAVGSPVSGRVVAEVESVVGFFANTLIFRSSLAGQPSARELLRQVRDTVIDGLEHQHLPFDRVVEALRDTRPAGAAPLVQACLGVHRRLTTGLDLPGLRCEVLDPEPGASKFDLTLSLGRTASALTGFLEYDTRIFDRPTAERMMAHLERLLDGMTSAPDRPIAVLPLLSDAERRRALVDWNDTATEFPAEADLADLFAAAVQKTPDVIALKTPGVPDHRGHVTRTPGVLDDRGHATRTPGVPDHRGHPVSYVELHARARAVAACLRRAGVRAGDSVAVVMERSAALVVATLGVIEANAAYVPIDPANPAERIGGMLRDAAVRVVLCGPEGVALGPGTGVAVLQLSADGMPADEPAGGVAEVPADVTRQGGNALAYVMYTSGSTGAPKGVAVPHRAIARLVLNTNYVAFLPGDVVALAANPAFDASTFEIWGALLNGATLLVLPRHTMLVPRDLASTLADHGVTTMFVTTALFNRVAFEMPEAFRTLKTLVVGGEALEPNAVERVLSAGPPARLVNGYGPTEATTFATWCEVTEVQPGATTIPIGRPISNTAVLVLEHRTSNDGSRVPAEPAPIGVLGEICIGGPGLALGYVGSPDLTAAKFVAHPFIAGARLYRTGDLGYYRDDGQIVYVRRLDGQLKIRGHRVEPAEIVRALDRHSSVRQRVGGVRPSPTGDRRLVAYVVVDPNAPVTASDLKQWLAARLPEFMVPAAVMLLDALPLGPTSKIDRAGLPAPTPLGPPGAFVPPRSGLETYIADVWQAMLGVDQVGRTDNFFELGGHSLTIVQVAARLERDLGRPIAAHWLFEHPSLDAFAARVGLVEVDRRLDPIRPRQAGQPNVPASPMQEEAWLRREVRPRDSGLMSVRAYDLEGSLDADALAASLTAMVARHEILRTGLAIENGRLVQRILPPYDVPVERVDLSTHPDADGEADRRVTAETLRPFHLATGPWLRAVVMTRSAERRRLIIALPHTCYDAWSLNLFFDELEHLYSARVLGKPAGLPPQGLQYADYSEWWRARAATPEYERQLAFWRDRLSNLTEVAPPARRRPSLVAAARQATRLLRLRVPGGGAVQAVAERAAALVRSVIARGPTSRVRAEKLGRLPISVPADRTRLLRALAREENVTLSAVLLAAFSAVLSRRSGNPDVAIAAFTANRQRPELARVMGHLGNTVAVRMNLETPNVLDGVNETGGSAFRALVRQAGAALVDAQLHGDVRFADVSRAVTAPGQLPLEHRIPVVFQLVESLVMTPRLPNVTVTDARTQQRDRSPRMAVTIVAGNERLTGSCSFDPTLYDSAACRSLVAEFKAALEAVVANPSVRSGRSSVRSGRSLDRPKES